jgi:hypothetical protein
MEAIQFIQTMPELLSEQFFNKVKNLYLDFKQTFSIPDANELLSRVQLLEYLQFYSNILWVWIKA